LDPEKEEIIRPQSTLVLATIVSVCVDDYSRVFCVLLQCSTGCIER